MLANSLLYSMQPGILVDLDQKILRNVAMLQIDLQKPEMQLQQKRTFMMRFFCKNS